MVCQNNVLQGYVPVLWWADLLAAVEVWVNTFVGVFTTFSVKTVMSDFFKKMYISEIKDLNEALKHMAYHILKSWNSTVPKLMQIFKEGY